MTRANGNVVGEAVRVGDAVTVNRLLRREPRVNSNNVKDLDIGERFFVTRVYSNRLIIRTVEYQDPIDQWEERKQWSFSLSRESVQFLDENYVPPPPPRRLGTKPEGEEFIDVDDPRIQWIWNDLGEYADRKNWCPQYDELCRDVGVPGRPRDFNVTRTLNGIQIRASIKARSQAEANNLFAQAMSAPEPTPEPDLAPAA